MNGLPYYKAYPRDFIEGTIGMPFEIKCAYRFVLDLIYMQDGALPDDARYISGLLGCSVRKWNSIRDELVSTGKLYVNGEFLSNYRADKMLETSRKYREKQAEKGRTSSKNNDIGETPGKPFARSNTESDKDSSPNGEQTRAKGARTSPTSKAFDEFWAIYPHKVGKRDAMKAFERACKRADFETIMAGLRRYIAKTDDRPWCNPATWLNQDRWEDQPAPPGAAGHSPPREERETIGSMFLDEAKRMGIFNGITGDAEGNLETGNGHGKGNGTGGTGQPAFKVIEGNRG